MYPLGLDNGTQLVHSHHVPSWYIQGAIMSTSHQGQQFKARLDTDLHVWLKEQAEKQDRSINYLINQAVKLLKQQAA